MDKKIAVIGAGASGLSAAIEAARFMKEKNVRAGITVFEHLVKPAKKILATGNGRCNFTNRDLSPSHYYGNEEFIKTALNSDCKNSENFLFSMGVLSFTEDGRVYPRSENAASVRDALLNTAALLGINIVTECEIKKLDFINNSFIINGENFGAVIVACGGKASPIHGSDGSGYKYLTDFGHTLKKPYPALTGFTSREKALKNLKGVRVKASLTLFDGKKPLGSDYGEVQFTENSVSGIPAFMLSHLCESKRDLNVKLDLFSETDSDKLFKFLSDRRYKSPLSETESVLSGLVSPKLSYAVMEKCEILPHTIFGNLGDKKLLDLCGTLKNLSLDIDGVKGFEAAQITCGGIDSAEFSAETMMSKKQNGLFACGEILNVHGDCGGYNLNMAFVTGRIAGTGAINYILKD